MRSFSAPNSEAELVARANQLAGLSLGQLAAELGTELPRNLRRHKGAVGSLLEHALGASAGSRPVPDFEQLGIELKTVPIGANLKPRESTHVCSVALNELNGLKWRHSTVFRKLARVLWFPVDSRPEVPLLERQLGTPTLWSPSAEVEAVLRRDWEEHMELLATGRFDLLDARLGTYLQIRPKAADSKALGASNDADGEPSATLPRGFYLRPVLTGSILDGSV